MTFHRFHPGRGHADLAKLPKGPNGRCLCRKCGAEVPAGRRTFCSDTCVEAWKLASNPGYVRRELFKRDRGVCRACRLDCHELSKIVKSLRGQLVLSVCDDAHDAISRAYREARKALGMGSRTTLWDADHIVEVRDGGGECGLDNYQTLCVWCHKRKTSERSRVGVHEPAARKASV